MDARNSRRFTCGWRPGSRLYFGAGLVCERENRQGRWNSGSCVPSTMSGRTRASAAGTPAVIAKARSAVNDSQENALSAITKVSAVAVRRAVGEAVCAPEPRATPCTVASQCQGRNASDRWQDGGAEYGLGGVADYAGSRRDAELGPRRRRAHGPCARCSLRCAELGGYRWRGSQVGTVCSDINGRMLWFGIKWNVSVAVGTLGCLNNPAVHVSI